MKIQKWKIWLLPVVIKQIQEANRLLALTVAAAVWEMTRVKQHKNKVIELLLDKATALGPLE